MFNNFDAKRSNKKLATTLQHTFIMEVDELPVKKLHCFCGVFGIPFSYNLYPNQWMLDTDDFFSSGSLHPFFSWYSCLSSKL